VAQGAKIVKCAGGKKIAFADEAYRGGRKNEE